MRALPARQAPPHHVRVRAARRRERLAAGCPPAGEGVGGRQGESEPAAAQRRAGHPVRAAVRRGDQRLREDPRGPRLERVRAQEPRPRHSRRVRAVDRRGAGRAEIRGRRSLARCSCLGAMSSDRAGALAEPKTWRDLREHVGGVAARGSAKRRSNHSSPPRAARRSSRTRTRLVFFAKDKNGADAPDRRRLQRLGSDAEGIRRLDRNDDAHRRHALVVSRGHGVYQRARRIRVPVRQGGGGRSAEPAGRAGVRRTTFRGPNAVLAGAAGD